MIRLYFQGAFWRAPLKSFSAQPADVKAFCGVSSSWLGASSNRPMAIKGMR